MMGQVISVTYKEISRLVGSSITLLRLFASLLLGRELECMCSVYDYSHRRLLGAQWNCVCVGVGVSFLFVCAFMCVCVCVCREREYERKSEKVCVYEIDR